MLHQAKLISLLIAVVLTELVNGQQPACTLKTTKPEPLVHKYNFDNCFVAQFAGYFTNLSDGKYMPIENGTINLPGSTCNGTDGSTKLIIDFICGNINLGFKRNPLNHTYASYISGTISNQNSTIVFTNNTPTFNTSAPGHYYKCDAEQVIHFETVQLTLKNVAFEVFRNSSSPEFYQIPEECALDSQPVSNLVRIGVGVCLLALVGIVIIAYFVGRRRWSERSTYESV